MRGARRVSTTVDTFPGRYCSCRRDYREHGVCAHITPSTMIQMCGRRARENRVASAPFVIRAHVRVSYPLRVRRRDAYCRRTRTARQEPKRKEKKRKKTPLKSMPRESLADSGPYRLTTRYPNGTLSSSVEPAGGYLASEEQRTLRENR